MPSCLSIMPLDQRKVRFFRALAITFRIACLVFKAMTTSRPSCSMSPGRRKPPVSQRRDKHSGNASRYDSLSSPEHLRDSLSFLFHIELVGPQGPVIFVSILWVRKLKSGSPCQPGENRPVCRIPMVSLPPPSW